jgi:hypothetical protein
MANPDTEFRCNPDRDIHQDVFKAETALHRIRVCYDDVNGEYCLQVTFKDRFIWDGKATVEMFYGLQETAMARALRFLARHPAPQARCNVDY